ncbi:MAG: hypothetical protein GYA48_02420 [Chloroflexi bacterium]|nr:hypothetical protein [Chloroflexota bacterium]
MQVNPLTIDAYIAGCPAEVQALLQNIRETIRQAAPEAQEKISYGMPTFFLHGNLVHFAAHKKHIGFYPAPSGIETFAEALAPYETSKGAVQFPLERSIPFDLIREITLFRVGENQAKAAAKKKK